MYHIAYHLEAQRRQRVIERKQDAIERLATKKVIIAESLSNSCAGLKLKRTVVRQSKSQHQSKAFSLMFL